MVAHGPPVQLRAQSADIGMKLFSYVVARDYGFAPNPFGLYCTLATCKPDIRRAAMPGDWVIGTGSAENMRGGHLVYAMQVSEALSFDRYWNDPRFQYKKPNLHGSKKQAFGDNIYHTISGDWEQVDSHHSYPDGTPNPANITRDTKTDRVLVATHFVYFGGIGPEIPDELRNFQGYDICKAGPGHRADAPPEMIDAFFRWLSSLDMQGYCGRPFNWSRTP